MTKPSDFPVIDADAHVLETERTWDYLEPSEEKYRPQIRSTPVTRGNLGSLTARSAALGSRHSVSAS